MFKIYIGRIFFLILFMSMALFSGFCSAAMSVSELTTAVNNLPESTEAERLKKAMLLWGLEDALDAQAAGQTQVVNDTYADIEEMLDQNIGQSAPALPN